MVLNLTSEGVLRWHDGDAMELLRHGERERENLGRKLGSQEKGGSFGDSGTVPCFCSTGLEDREGVHAWQLSTATMDFSG